MEDILLNIGQETRLRLKFFEAVHPTLVPIKADDWRFIYRLYNGDRLFDSGLFTSDFLINEERQLLFLQEYSTFLLDRERIKTDDDVVFNLRLFDLKNGNTGKFSTLTGGYFKLQALVGNNLIFKKQYQGVTKEFEVDIEAITLVETPKL